MHRCRNNRKSKNASANPLPILSPSKIPLAVEVKAMIVSEQREEPEVVKTRGRGTSSDIKTLRSTSSEKIQKATRKQSAVFAPLECSRLRLRPGRVEKSRVT